jgi:hypothetical protein
MKQGGIWTTKMWRKVVSDDNVTKLPDRGQIQRNKEIAEALARKCEDRDVRHGATVLLQAIAADVHGWEHLPITPPKLIEVIREELAEYTVQMRKQQADRFSKLLWDAGVPQNMIDKLYDNPGTNLVQEV